MFWLRPVEIGDVNGTEQINKQRYISLTLIAT